MSAPRTKRLFAGAASDPAQRQITSFFRRNDGESATDLTPAAAHLPAQVQANLLSVGMRVRKSVPEGYKTGSDCGSFSLWSDADPQQSHLATAAAQQNTPFAPEKRELLPFCGIHKVGGLASQPDFDGPSLFPPSAFEMSSSDAVPDLDDCPGLTSSQESAASYTSVETVPTSSPAAAPRRKRFYAEDESVDRPVSLRDEWLDGEVSPRTLAPVGWGDNGRVMAVPRKRGAGGVVGAGKEAASSRPPARLTDLGQENLDLAMEADFEEASFLDYHTWGTAPRDMEMGGI